MTKMKKSNLVKVCLALVISIMFFACSNKLKDKNIIEQKLEKTINKDIIDSIETKFIIDKKKLAIYKSLSNQMINDIYQRGNTLDISSSGNLIYEPFGITPFADSLSVKYNEIFTKEPIAVETQKIQKFLLNYNKSFIKIIQFDRDFFPERAEDLAEYRHTAPDLASIIEAKLKDSEIILNKNIRVGMNKKDFFNSFLGIYDESLAKINILINGDTAGEFMTQYYKFNNDTLIEIIFKGNDYLK